MELAWSKKISIHFLAKRVFLAYYGENPRIANYNALAPFETQTMISQFGIYEFMNFGIGTNVVVVYVNSLNKKDPPMTLLPH